MTKALLAPALITAGALLMWWWLGKPGLWLRDRMAWVRLTDPGDGAVVQWQGGDEQNVSIQGSTGLLSCDLALSARSLGADNASKSKWQSAESTLGKFTGDVSLKPGWNLLSVKGRWWDHAFAGSARIGLGDVFIVAGQSNAVGYAEEFFVAESENVRAGSLCGDGTIVWRRADDPQSPQGKGSPWPMVGDEYGAATKLPVGFVNIAENGSSIESWMPGATLFAGLEQTLKSTGPSRVRAILWAQGEADSGMSADRYARCLETIIRAVNASMPERAPIPWVVAVSSYVQGARVEKVRRGQETVIAAGLALPGPDTDILGREHRQQDGVHFNAEGTRALASLWAENLKKHFAAKGPK